MLADQITGNADVLLKSETKLDASFPINQFKIPGFSTPFRRGRDQYGPGLLVFVREDIPAKYLSSESTPIEGTYAELKFRKKNWLLCCTYNPNRNVITNHLDAAKRSLDPYSRKYDNLMVIGDLNAKTNVECMKLFCETYDLSSLIKVLTCYKNPEKPLCIDLPSTNQPKNFQNSSVVETGLSDFHKMTVTVMKSTFEKLKPTEGTGKEFCNEKFRTQLLTKLSLESFNNSSNGINRFLEIGVKTPEIFAPRKKIYLRGNSMPFMKKKLS